MINIKKIIPTVMTGKNNYVTNNQELNLSNSDVNFGMKIMIDSSSFNLHDVNLVTKMMDKISDSAEPIDQFIHSHPDYFGTNTQEVLDLIQKYADIGGDKLVVYIKQITNKNPSGHYLPTDIISDLHYKTSDMQSIEKCVSNPFCSYSERATLWESSFVSQASFTEHTQLSRFQHIKWLFKNLFRI